MSSRSLTFSRRAAGSSGVWALLVLIVLIVLLLTVTSLRRQAPESTRPFAPDSAAPTGLLALVRWLEALGYDVQRTDDRPFAELSAARLMLVYPNQRPYSAEEAAQLQRWVADGGTLLLAGPAPTDTALVDAFGVRMVATEDLTGARFQSQPLLPEGRTSYWQSLQFEANSLDLSGAPGAVAVLTSYDGAAALAVQTVGAGRVWHVVPALALTNDGLRQNSQGELLPALLRNLPAGSTIVFDTAHLFDLSRTAQPIATLQDWLYRTPGGWATLLGLVACAVYLLLQGRRLGPALTSTAERPRREAAEHVRALAALARRAQLSRDLVEYQRRRLKRGLARRQPISADLPDAEFVARLGSMTPALAPEIVMQVDVLLRDLRPERDEQQLVMLAAAIDDLLRQVGERL